jgi:hypothetical protein
MPHEPDYDLIRPADETPPLDAPPPRPVGVWIAVAALIVATAIAAYVVFGRRRPPAPVTTPAQSAEALHAPVQPLGGEPAAIDVPPLDQSDSLVRELVRKISSHPQVAAWLTTNGLLRNFTVVVANIAQGATPAVHLQVIRPASAFKVIDREGNLFIDPESYHRYDRLAAAVASIDATAAARLYATVKPRVGDAYRDLGFPNAPFDQALERAIVVLLETPIVEDPVRVERRGGVGYGFADPRLETLTAAQKQLLRTGPANVRTIQASLRAIALALGIPAERLPAAHTSASRQD